MRPTAAAVATGGDNRGNGGGVASLATLCARVVVTAAEHVRVAAAPGEVADGVVKTMFDERLTDGRPEAARRALARVGPMLREFVLPPGTAGRVGRELVAGVAEHCRALWALSLRGCAAVTPAALAAIARNTASTLEHLDVGECSALDSSSIAAVARLCTRLRSLTADHCVGAKQPLVVDAPVLESLRVMGLVVPQLTLRCPQLLLLDCSDCWDVETLAWNCGSAVPLAEANLFRCKKLRGGSFAAFINANCTPALRYLNICECQFVAGRDAAAAVTGLSQLTHMVADMCALLDDEAIAALARSCPRLASVYFNECPRVTEAGCAELARCTMLEGCTFPTTVGDVSLMAIARAAAASLVVVDVTGSTTLTDAGVSTLLQSCVSLRTLTISECPRLTDACFAPLSAADGGAAGTKLRNLTAQMTLHTDSALHILAGRCHSLVSIDLLHNGRITDAGVIELIRCCPLLASVNLSFCTLITDATLAAFAASGSPPQPTASASPPLSLDVYGCNQVTADAVIALLASTTRSIRDINVNMSIRERISQLPVAALRGARVHSQRGDPIFP